MKRLFFPLMALFFLASIYVMFFKMTPDFGFSWAMPLMLIPFIHRVIWDWRTQKVLKKEVDHWRHTKVTAVIMVSVAGVVWGSSPVKYVIQPFLLEWAIFFALFDGTRNLAVGKAWNYVDEEKDGIGSKEDKVTSQVGIYAMTFARICAILIGLAIYFYVSLIA